MPGSANVSVSLPNASVSRPNVRDASRPTMILTTWTNMFESTLSVAAVVVALLVGASAWFGIARLKQRLDAAHTRIEALEEQLELVRQSISGLTAGAVGLDRRVYELLQRERELAERQENFEIQQIDEQPYGQAIRLVQQGAGAGRLVSELDISESEAELIVRLHGQRDSA